MERTVVDNSTVYLASTITKAPITILEKQDSAVFAANEDSIYIYNTESGELKALDVIYPLNGVQPTITALRKESNGSLLIGTQSHGLFSIKIKDTDHLSAFALSVLAEVQYYAAAVYAIEGDAMGRLWIATSEGLFLFSGDHQFLRRYNVSDGIQANKFNFGSSLNDTDGNLYFGGSRGYNRFHPSKVSHTAEPPKVFATRVRLSGENSPIELESSNLNSIILNHKDRFITFEFSALDFTDPENTRYRHKLVGFDTDWIDIGNRGAATYTNLPAGDYVFRVQAVNSAGVWNYQGLSIDLEVRPAPWLTMWAFAAYFILICGLVYMGLKIYRSQMLKKQQLQQAIELQQIADRFADSLQDQLEFQGKFTDSVHSYNKQLLYWVRFCTDTTVEWEPAVSELVHDRLQFRLGILELIQDSLYYRGEKLYSNLKTYTARLVNLAGASHAEVLSRLTTVNDIREELFPAEQAIPLAIIMAELFDNSLAHGFVNHPAACFVRFSVTVTADPTSGSDSVKFVYQDDGIGIPEGLAFDASETAGFTIMEHAAEALGCDLAIVGRDRNMVVAEFDIAWAS